MMFPAPPKETDPRTWPGMLLYAYTILGEAEGEPDEGKLAVAWTIRSRMDHSKESVEATILKPFQFSFWNADAAGIRKARLTAPDPLVVERCWRAAAGAYWRLLPDPTGGARWYANVPLVREQRGGTLPAWLDQALAVGDFVRLGRHHFFRRIA